MANASSTIPDKPAQTQTGLGLRCSFRQTVYMRKATYATKLYGKYEWTGHCFQRRHTTAFLVTSFICFKDGIKI